MRWTQNLMREVAQEERSGLGLGPLDAFEAASKSGDPATLVAASAPIETTSGATT